VAVKPVTWGFRTLRIFRGPWDPVNGSPGACRALIYTVTAYNRTDFHRQRIGPRWAFRSNSIRSRPIFSSPSPFERAWAQGERSGSNQGFRSAFVRSRYSWRSRFCLDRIAAPLEGGFQIPDFPSPGAFIFLIFAGGPQPVEPGGPKKVVLQLRQLPNQGFRAVFLP